MSAYRPIPDSYWIDDSVLLPAGGGPGRLLAGEYPCAKERGEAERKLTALLAAGVTGFLDLTEAGEYNLVPYMPIVRALTAAPIQYRRAAIPDLQTPSTEELIDILDYLDAAKAAGHTVYVHCYGGIGRTGTVIGCYLVRHGLTGDQALEQIARWREGTPDGTRWSPETTAQRKLVRSWRPGS